MKSTLAEYGYPEYYQGPARFASDAYAVFNSQEALASHLPKSNRFRFFHIIPPGPYEVNFDYYSTWGANYRFVIAPFSQVLSEVGSIFRTTVKLDNASIESIANLNLPKDVLQRLNSLTNQEFESESELFAAVTDEIGSANAKMFWRVIWTFAKFSPKTD